MKNRLNLYKILEQYEVSVGLKIEFLDKIKKNILSKFTSFKQFNSKRFDIPEKSFCNKLNGKYCFKYSKLIYVCQSLNISLDEIRKNIIGFRVQGSKRKLSKIPKYLIIDELFVEGFALYLAEGDNGSCGIKQPKKLRFTNKEPYVIKRYIKWLQTYFPKNEFYVRMEYSKNYIPLKEELNQILFNFYLDRSQLRTKLIYPKRKTTKFFRVCLDDIVITKLILDLEKEIKNLILKNKTLMKPYIKGMMIGEGTAYFNVSKYVRIEMKNEFEIIYLKKLFDKLGYKVKIYTRNTRKNMWSIYIGGRKNLMKYYEEIGFGIHEKRQLILQKIYDYYLYNPKMKYYYKIK